MHTIRQFRAALMPVAALVSLAVPALSETAGPGPARNALNALIAAPDSPLPSGTQVQSVGIADGLATVSFSRALKDNFHGGDTDEVNAINGILRALGPYPTISRVRILVAEQPVDSLGGMIVISQPPAVIRPAGYAEAHRVYFHRRLPARD